MSRLEQIEQFVRDLEPRELAEFATWFEAYQARQWDNRFTSDVQKGALDALADQALGQLRAGKTKPL
ncbi:hypothetical protein BJF93_12010 [Xaviernesmea oryzae]|uniref:Uncharacterized protein n=1 Tax=Xaviernesmea oryzae TaxID=464029 RepID=A0A1Q9AVF6_9HYPH|nr:hypothetical protein [Xaviernesmea oryzae]OLP59435.1 hypothetical protein BJF93_12010 [Xaviernesmea oryzae]SEL60128.1 hypothetical protein SAMN04487976_11066 [Xaviernesmea oryzae]